jgi:hypothetical protein
MAKEWILNQAMNRRPMNGTGYTTSIFPSK